MNRKQLAETIEGYDAEIAALQFSKRTTYEDYRHDLAKSGFDKDAVKAEIEAFKLALRRKLAVKKSSDEAVEAQGELVDEIFAEITAVRAPRATRVENIEEFGSRADDGASLSVHASAGFPTSSAGTEGEADRQPIIEPEAAMLPQTAPIIGAPSTSAGQVAVESPATNITPINRVNPKTHFANSKGLPRLHGCMKPEACGGSHRALCFTCARASEGSAA